MSSPRRLRVVGSPWIDLFGQVHVYMNQLELVVKIRIRMQIKVRLPEVELELPNSEPAALAARTPGSMRAQPPPQ